MFKSFDWPRLGLEPEPRWIVPLAVRDPQQMEAWQTIWTRDGELRTVQNLPNHQAQ